MSTRDYANKRRSKQKGKTATKTRTTSSQVSSVLQRVPIGALLLFCVFGAGFGMVLHTIKGSANTAKAQTKAISPPASKTQTELPKPPEEKWTYLEELAKKEVAVEVSKVKKASKLYRIQCGSFRRRIDAEQMQAKIAFAGLVAQIFATEGTKGIWYRVVLGPYEGRRVTEPVRHKIQRVGIESCKVWYW